MTETNDAVLIGGPEKRDIRIVPYDPRWPAQYEHHARVVSGVLGDSLIAVHHVGSTSVAGLAAKPIIDILVVVADSSDEASYLPALEHANYVLRVREPGWHQHRMLRAPTKDVHIHVFSPDSPEIGRNLLFRDRLRSHPADRQRYEDAKRRLAAQPWPDMNAYADAKSDVIESIIAAAEAHSHSP
jgi:GrpB-like predicted nucleotidyltransferase (UPF0157 family)